MREPCIKIRSNSPHYYEQEFILLGDESQTHLSNVDCSLPEIIMFLLLLENAKFLMIFSVHCWGPCSALNLVAFAKIMKKYDKVAKHMGSYYMKEVECSHFASSDVVHIKFSLPMDLLSHCLVLFGICNSWLSLQCTSVSVLEARLILLLSNNLLTVELHFEVLREDEL